MNAIRTERQYDDIDFSTIPSTPTTRGAPRQSITNAINDNENVIAYIESLLLDITNQELPARQIVAQQKSAFICLLDDDDASSYLLQKTLSDLGHLVDRFKTSLAAISSLTKIPYDVFIVNQVANSAGLKETALINNYREREIQNRLAPILALTSSNNPADSTMLFEAGANDVLHRPLNRYALQAIILEHLTRSKTPRRQPPKLQVCFVDDYCITSRSITALFETHGHKIDHFWDIEEALHSLETIPYDVVLVNQFSVDNIATFERFLKNAKQLHRKARKNIPILALTDRPSKANSKRWQRLGANRILVAPTHLRRGARFREVEVTSSRIHVLPRTSNEYVDDRCRRKSQKEAAPVDDAQYSTIANEIEPESPSAKTYGVFEHDTFVSAKRQADGKAGKGEEDVAILPDVSRLGVVLLALSLITCLTAYVVAAKPWSTLHIF